MHGMGRAKISYFKTNDKGLIFSDQFYSVCLDKIANFLKASKYEIIIIFVETHFPVESLMLCPNCIQRSNYGYQTLQLEHKVINIGN